MTCIAIPNGILCAADEIDRPAGVDLRTREGREREVIEQVRQFGGFTVWWVTEHQTRACAADRLHARGVIIPDKMTPYPWCSYRLQEAAA